MKTLLLMRHGKSSWAQPLLEDFDRPLKKRGQRASKAIGRWIRQHRLTPDHVISSSAVRALETARIVSKAAGYSGPLATTEKLYFAGVQGYLDTIAELDPTHQTVLLVGHNPNMEDLAGRLTGQSLTLPTAALVRIEWPSESWTPLPDGSARLLSVTLPRELE